MKRSVNFIMMAGFAALAVSCLDELNGGAETEATGASFIIEDFKPEAMTRTAFQTSSMQFQWSESDTLGIFPSKGFQAVFPMEKGAGSNVAVFDGGGWGLRADASYYAYYPFSIDNFESESKREHVYYSYEGQQAGFADKDGLVNLSGYDYMASGVSKLENGRVTFTFKHLGALCRICFEAPATARYSEIIIEADEAVFPVEGYFNATEKVENIRLVCDSDMSNQFAIAFPDNGKVINENEKIDIYFLMPPVDLQGQMLKFIIKDNKGQSYCEELEGKDIKAGMTYGWDYMPDVPEAPEVAIAIDGDFADWEVLTASNYEGTIYVCDAPNYTHESIRNLKATSDSDLIYMYLEIRTADIASIEGGDRGDSNCGLTVDGYFIPTPGPIYVDINAGSADALLPHIFYEFTDLETGDVGYAWNNFKMDNCITLIIWRNTATNIVDLCWSQLNSLQSKFADGCYDEDSDFQSVEGSLWDPMLDNLVVTFDNFKAVIDGAWTKIELAIDPTQLFVNGEQGADIPKIDFGVFYKNSGSLDYYWQLTGILPGDRLPATLVLAQ